MNSGRASRGAPWWSLVGLLAVAVVAVSAAGVAVSLRGSRLAASAPRTFTVSGEDPRRAEVLDSATEGVVAALSYRHDTVEDDVERATAYLTGEFLDYYLEFIQEVVIPTATDTGTTTTATVSADGVESISDDTATVLVFIDQATTSAAERTPVATKSAVRLDMRLIDGDWLIEDMTPL